MLKNPVVFMTFKGKLICHDCMDKTWFTNARYVDTYFIEAINPSNSKNVSYCYYCGMPIGELIVPTGITSLLPPAEWKKGDIIQASKCLLRVQDVERKDRQIWTFSPHGVLQTFDKRETVRTWKVIARL